MSYELVFFETQPGHAPALEFLRRQSKAVRAEGGWLLEQLQKYGSSLGRQIVVVTHGFPKKTMKVPKVEIERARKMRAEWLSRG